MNFAPSTVSQKQSNGNVSWDVFYTALFGVGNFSNTIDGFNIRYIWRGAFSVARFDKLGDARASTRGTSDRVAPRFFVYVSDELSISLLES